MNKRFWGRANEKDAFLISLSNENLKADITNYGAAIVRLWVPDRNGNLVDVVMGYDTVTEYIDQECYVGVTAGRCANRINDSRFTLNGQEFLLDQNEGKNHLHGGFKGFGKAVWDIESYGNDYVVLKYLSPDGEGGYPGNLNCTVEYRLEGSQLKILYTGIADKDTIMNLTNHSYFNLKGHGSGTIKDHIVCIDADQITEVGSDSCSTGKFLSVADTPFDLRTPVKIGEMLEKDHYQMEYGRGFDHNFVLNKHQDHTPVADLFSSDSGIGLKVYTDMEGMHFYTGNHLGESVRGKSGAAYPKFSALCFETQHYPNAINMSQFPSPVIKEGEEKKSMTAFEFYTK